MTLAYHCETRCILKPVIKYVSTVLDSVTVIYGVPGVCAIVLSVFCVKLSPYVLSTVFRMLEGTRIMVLIKEMYCALSYGKPSSSENLFRKITFDRWGGRPMARVERIQNH